MADYLNTINPDANPDTIREMIATSGSSPDSESQENKGIGYFRGDVYKFAEPLIVLPKEIIRDDSIIRVDATNTDKDSKTSATKQELPTTNVTADAATKLPKKQMQQNKDYQQQKYPQM